MKIGIAGACMVVFLLARPLQAQEADQSERLERLQRIVEEQNRTISDLMQRLESLEAAQNKQERWISEKKEEKPLWTDRVTLRGDLRYRYEWIEDDRNDDDRNRNRIRARLGADAAATDTVDLHFQLSTSESGGDEDLGDPVSGNQTLDNAWSLKEVWVSEAYFDWHPAAISGLHVLGGKIKRPFLTPNDSELIWDSDVNPEGGAVAYTKEWDTTKLYGNLYGFYVEERSSDADSGLFGGQAAVKQELAFAHGAYVKAGLGYFDYGNTEGRETFYEEGEGFGNSLLPDGTYAEDFDEVELFGEFGWKIRNIPVAAFADYVQNLAADKEDTGWSLGFTVGKAREPRSWTFRYLYRELERDAVLGLFADSDFGGGGTNVDGHELNFTCQLAKNWQLAASYFNNDTGIADEDDEEGFQRLQLDVIFKF